jgi:cytochrome c556
MRLPLGVFVLVIAFAPVALAQKVKYPIFTVEQLNEAMKTVGLAFGLASRAATGNDAQNAKDYLIRARDQLATTITFWRDRKKDDAVSMLRETLKKMDALDAALSAPSPNAATVKTLVDEIGVGCESCHAKYREQDPATKAYRVIPDLAR